MTFGAGDIYCVSCVFIMGIMPVDVGVRWVEYGSIVSVILLFGLRKGHV